MHRERDSDETVELTAEQFRFVRRAHGRLVRNAPGGHGHVFVYGDEHLATKRWLIDTDGQVLDVVAFHRGPIDDGRIDDEIAVAEICSRRQI